MQVRRSRQLVISFVATVVNYEYKFMWTFSQASRFQKACKRSENRPK